MIGRGVVKSRLRLTVCPFAPSRHVHVTATAMSSESCAACRVCCLAASCSLLATSRCCLSPLPAAAASVVLCAFPTHRRRLPLAVPAAPALKKRRAPIDRRVARRRSRIVPESIHSSHIKHDASGPCTVHKHTRASYQPTRNVSRASPWPLCTLHEHGLSADALYLLPLVAARRPPLVCRLLFLLLPLLCCIALSPSRFLANSLASKRLLSLLLFRVVRATSLLRSSCSVPRPAIYRP